LKLPGNDTQKQAAVNEALRGKLNSGWEHMGVLCGIDIIEIDRIKKSIDKLGQAFVGRVFTPVEAAYCESKKAIRYKSYSARFAAKEAAAKALGTGIAEGILWTDIEILINDRGKPCITLKGKAREIYEALGADDISVSLSHSENYAVANVVIQTRG
jgi:holo-[acyl-carrier protein] synthase